MKLTSIGDGSILSRQEIGGKERNPCFFIGAGAVLEIACWVVSTLPSPFSESKKKGNHDLS